MTVAVPISAEAAAEAAKQEDNSENLGRATNCERLPRLAAPDCAPQWFASVRCRTNARALLEPQMAKQGPARASAGPARLGPRRVSSGLFASAPIDPRDREQTANLESRGRIMRSNSVKDGWQRFLDRLRRLWGKPRKAGWLPGVYP